MNRSLSLSALVVALAACSPGGSAQSQSQSQSQPTPTPASTPTPVATATPAAAASDADTHTVPKPGMLKTFSDWVVGCDNGLRCTMASLLAMDAAPDGPPNTITLIREAGAGGAWSLAPGDGKPPVFTVDGRRIGSDAAALAAAIANGTSLTVAGSPGTISLKGASAALRYIDAAQGRAGTTSAVVARGSATAVPAAPALPVVRAIALTPTGGALTPAQVATMKKLGDCQDMENFDAPTLARAGKDTLIAALPCSAGAYNVIMALFVVQGGKVTPAQVDAPAGFEATGADSQTPVHSIINADIAGGDLTSYAKGRGLGDCGVSQTFAWDGRRLRLVEQAEMSECRGNTDTISTWRARTIR